MQKDERFAILYREHFRKVFRLCTGYFNGDEDQAADVVQEIFIKVWQNLESFRNESSITTWIYRIAVNTCLLHLRKPSVKNEVKISFMPDLAAEEYNTQTELQFKKMYACIEQLEVTGKMIILMVLEGIEYAVISEVAGVSEETLRVKIHRIKKTLANCVKL